MPSRTLSWFMQSFEGTQDIVRCNIKVEEDDDVRYGIDYTLDEAKLKEHAAGHGRNTWDEHDVCAVLGIKTGRAVVIKPKSEKPPAHPVEQ